MQLVEVLGVDWGNPYRRARLFGYAAYSVEDRMFPHKDNKVSCSTQMSVVFGTDYGLWSTRDWKIRWFPLWFDAARH